MPIQAIEFLYILAIMPLSGLRQAQVHRTPNKTYMHECI